MWKPDANQGQTAVWMLMAMGGLSFVILISVSLYVALSTINNACG